MVIQIGLHKCTSRCAKCIILTLIVYRILTILAITCCAVSHRVGCETVEPAWG